MLTFEVYTCMPVTQHVSYINSTHTAFKGAETAGARGGGAPTAIAETSGTQVSFRPRNNLPNLGIYWLIFNILHVSIHLKYFIQN